jgi:hypothetical protein
MDESCVNMYMQAQAEIPQRRKKVFARFAGLQKRAVGQKKASKSTWIKRRLLGALKERKDWLSSMRKELADGRGDGSCI